MTTDKWSSLFLMINFGSLILLSFLSLANPIRANRTANRLFGIFFLQWASFYIDEIIYLLFNITLPSEWRILLRGVQYFCPLLFYFIVVFYSNPGFKLKKNAIRHFALPIVYLFLLYYFEITQNTTLNYILIIIMLCQALFYVLAAYVQIRKHQKVVAQFSSQGMEIDLSWLQKIVIGLLLILITIIIYNIFFGLEQLNLTMNVICLIGIYYIAYHAMKQKEIYPHLKEAEIEEVISLVEEPLLSESKKKLISDEEMNLLKEQLAEFMLLKKPYLDTELNLVSLAEAFGTSTHKLSYIINTGFQVNFFTFISKYRVEEAKLLLKSTQMDKYSILGIAYQAGFNSKSAFNTTFKKLTNQTPSDYKNSSRSL